MKIKSNSKNINAPKRPTYYSSLSLNTPYYRGVISIFRTGGRIYKTDGTYITFSQDSSLEVIVLSGDGKAWYRNNEYTNVDYMIMLNENNGERRGYM